MAATGVAPVDDDTDDYPPDDPTPEPAPARKTPTAAAPPAEPAPAKPRRSKALLDAVGEFGYAEDALGDLTNEEAWEEAHNLRKHRGQPAAPAAPAPKTAEPADPDEAYLDQLAAADPDLARIIRKRMARDDKPLTELREQVEGLTKAEQARQTKVMVRMLDKAFDALPDEYKPLVGEGGIEDVDQLSQAARGAVWKAADVRPQDGAKAVAAKIAAAAEKVLGARVKAAPPPDPYAVAAAKKPTPPKDPVNGRFTKEEFANGHVLRPTGRKVGTEELSDAETVRRLRQEHGETRNSSRVAFDDDDDMPE